MRLIPSVSRLSIASGLWLLGVLGASSVLAQELPPITCTASAEPAALRQGSVSERTSDVVLTCTGGSPRDSDEFVLPMDFLITLSQPVMTRDLGGWTESFAVVDEPAVPSQRACTDSEGCLMLGTGSGIATYSGAQGRPNLFPGGVDGSTLFYSIPFDAPGSGQRRIRFTNLKINASGLGAGVAVTAQVVASGQIPINIANPVPIVGTVEEAFGLSVNNVQGTAGITHFTVSVEELFSTALKPRTSIGPTAGAQANPGGAPLEYETGFFNPNLPNTGRGNLGTAGLANSGTRIRLQVSPVQGNMTLSSPSTLTLPGGGSARLVSTGQFGEGSYTPATATTMPAFNGVATAVYEVTQTTANSLDSLEIPIVVIAPAPPTSLSVNIAIAPVAYENAAYTPRFLIGATKTVLQPLTLLTKTLLNGAVGSSYQDSFSANGGLPPYTFSNSAGILPSGLRLSSDGVLSGTPSTPGTFRFDVTVTDSNKNSASLGYLLTIVGGATLGALPATVSFNAVEKGPLPIVQDVHIFSQPVSNPQSFKVTIDDGKGGAAPSWLKVSLTTATTPAIVTVSIDQANLSVGTYTARLRASVPANPNLPALDIPVTLTVTAAAPKIEVAPNLLTFTMPSSAPGQRTGTVQISNKGGGSITYSTSVANGSRWISAAPTSGTVDPRNPASVRVTVDSTGLQAGIYRDVIHVNSPACPSAAPEVCNIPVLLRVTPSGARLTLDRTGLRFLQRTGVATPVTREVHLSSSDSGSSINWTAELIRGGEWFTLSSGSGSASQSTPSTLKVNVKASASTLAIGRYYGLIRITAPSAVNSTQYVVTVLQVSSANDPVDIDLDPGGLFLTSTARSSQQAKTNVTMNVDSTATVSYQAAAATTDGAAWLSVSPASGDASLRQSQTLAITADPRSLTAGIYTGSVTVASGTTSRAVSVVFIVTDAVSDAMPTPGVRAAACSPNRAAVATTSMADNFSIPAGWPSTIAVQVRDNCGAAVTNATVVARFTNGDAPLSLDPDDAPTGIYSATWQPGVVADPMNVTVSALTSQFPEARAALAGNIRENKVPTLARGGTVHPFDRQLGGLLSPGQPVEIYGAELASTTEGTFVPLPSTFKGSNVLIGPYDAPLFFVSPGQLNAQVPSELIPGRTYPIVLSANGAITIPDQIDIVGVQPGAAAFSDGGLIVQHGADYSLVTAANPAKRGEFLIMYLVGLGATNPPVATGTASPSTAPLGQPTNSVTMTLDGAPVTPGFVGLTPGGIGLFQINFQVPANARLNAPLDVIVKQGSYTAKKTTLTVAQ